MEYWKWPDRLHYAVDMARLAGDGEVVVLDEDEFAERRGGYPPGVVEQALAETAQVARALAEKAFPFDGSEEAIWTLAC